MSLEQLSEDRTIELNFGHKFTFDIMRRFVPSCRFRDSLRIKVQRSQTNGEKARKNRTIVPASAANDAYVPEDNLRRIGIVQAMPYIDSYDTTAIQVFISTDNGSNSSALSVFDVRTGHPDQPLRADIEHLYGLQFPFKISGLLATKEQPVYQPTRTHTIVYGLWNKIDDVVGTGGVYLVSFPELEIRELVSYQEVFNQWRPHQLKSKPVVVDGNVVIPGSGRQSDCDIALLAEKHFQLLHDITALGNYPLEPIENSRFLYREE